MLPSSLRRGWPQCQEDAWGLGPAGPTPRVTGTIPKVLFTMRSHPFGNQTDRSCRAHHPSEPLPATQGTSPATPPGCPTGSPPRPRLTPAPRVGCQPLWNVDQSSRVSDHQRQSLALPPRPGQLKQVALKRHVGRALGTAGRGRQSHTDSGSAVSTARELARQKPRGQPHPPWTAAAPALDGSPTCPGRQPHPPWTAAPPVVNPANDSPGCWAARWGPGWGPGRGRGWRCRAGAGITGSQGLGGSARRPGSSGDMPSRLCHFSGQGDQGYFGAVWEEPGAGQGAGMV